MYFCEIRVLHVCRTLLERIVLNNLVTLQSYETGLIEYIKLYHHNKITHTCAMPKCWPTFIVSRGKMEHGGKMEHQVFWKNHARRGSIFKSTWFLSSASSASCMEIKLAIDHVFSISLKRNFSLLIYQFTRVLTSSALTNKVIEPLHVVEYNYVPIVLIFTSFDWATGDIIVHIMAFP